MMRTPRNAEGNRLVPKGVYKGIVGVNPFGGKDMFLYFSISSHKHFAESLSYIQSIAYTDESCSVKVYKVNVRCQ